MRFFVVLFMIVILTANASNTTLPVSYVDPKKFSGLWYEIARTYNSYEKDCVAATVEYTLKEKNRYKVNNRCFEKVIGGNLIEYKGTAKAVNGKSMSEIDMTYYYIFTNRYNVIYLEKDYSATVVADEEFDLVWIMSRKPKMNQTKLRKILAKLEKSMDINRLIYTPQDKKGRYK